MAKKRKKKQKSKLWMLLIVTVVVAMAYYFGMAYFAEEKEMEAAKMANYAVFGINIPNNYTIHGIDVSSHQNFIHWPSIKEMKLHNVQIDFAFMKATEGLNDVDQRFKQNWLAAQQNHLVRGAYHFFIATKTGKEQAQHYIKTVQLQKGDLPPVLDIEELYGVDPVLVRTRVKEWLETIEAYYQVKPIIYSNADFYDRVLGNDFLDYPLWIAYYLDKDQPPIHRDWLFWQYSDRGRVNGVTTKVDFNVFNGDSLKFRQILLQY